MKRYTVTVRTRTARYVYTAINTCSADVVSDAVDRFGPCCVFVRPQS